MPTVAQAGFPQLTFDGLVGIYGTRDMPAELRERIATDVREALSRSGDCERDWTPPARSWSPGSAAEFAAAIERQRATVAEVAKVLGIKAAHSDRAAFGAVRPRAFPLRSGCL